MANGDSEGNLTVPFGTIGKDDAYLAGGKGANLGELTRAGVRVPPGFVIRCDAYFRFIDGAGLRSRIDRLLAGLDPNDRAQLDPVAREAKQPFSPRELRARVKAALRRGTIEASGNTARVRYDPRYHLDLVRENGRWRRRCPQLGDG